MMPWIDAATVPGRPGAAHRSALLASWLALWLLLAACAGVPVSYYDATTYANLVDLKVDTTLLVGTFDTTRLKENQTQIAAVSRNLKRAYEYERGKGDPNSDTVKQLDIIMNLFNEDVQTYRDNGPGTLGKRYFQEAAGVLGQAFDIAIATENEKNKDKR